MSRKHNYPKNIKSRDTSYARSTQLVEEHGIKKIKRLWTRYGMYKCGEILDTSPFIIRHLVHKHNWKRPASRAPFIYKGVQRGRMPASHYKSLDFSRSNYKPKKKEHSVMNNSTINAESIQKKEQQFLKWVNENPNHEWPYNWEIAEILKEFPELDSLVSLYKVMQDDKYFDRDHFVEVIETWNFYWTNVAG